MQSKKNDVKIGIYKVVESERRVMFEGVLVGLIVAVFCMGVLNYWMYSRLRMWEKQNMKIDVLVQPEMKSFIQEVNATHMSKSLQNSGVVNDSISNAMAKWSAYYGIPFRLTMNIASVESRFYPRAVGRAGEIGLMQILPSTALEISREMGYQAVYISDSSQVYIIIKGERVSLYDIDWNVRFACYHLWRSKFWISWHQAVLAYNGGKKYPELVRYIHTRY